MELCSEKGKAFTQTQPDPESSVVPATLSSGIPRAAQGTRFLSHNLGATGNLLKIVLPRKGEKGKEKETSALPTFSTSEN